ncbi:FAD/NAD(P)-binding domain-containing protein [Mycena metata]|uniref:FAD/NAD(P)-binding domain-containing protein n=1 Tax=Mycena metata TaxID=1033252 RepID=A0AAD7NCE0_9AGAR|nr:FAD/NAD(P)-binding domain-containing protein [Mycena metata]
MNPDETFAVATTWLASLGSAVDAETFAGHFLPTGWLRDLLCFSWDFRTLAGRGKIAEFLSANVTNSDLSVSRFARAGLSDFQLETTSTLGSPATFPIPNNPQIQGVSGVFIFSLTSPPAKGRGFFRLARDAEGSWKAFTLLTNIQDLVGHEEAVGRPLGYLETPWEEIRAKRIREVEEDPTVLIVGGGQSGLMCAARFGRMGIRAIIIEKTARIGDVWRNRYPNLSLHTGAHHSSILYHPWPKTYPFYLPKEKIADFLEAYAIGQELNVWTSSTIIDHPTYNGVTRRWSVEIERSGKRVPLTPRHIVLATGNGEARTPTWPGIDSFAGVLYHSDNHKGGAPFKGKRVVVVGACNAAGDICKDFVHKGAAEVTMVQRSATCVISETAAKVGFDSAFPDKLSIEDADLQNQSTPYALVMQVAAGGLTQRLKNMDEKLLQGLEKAGFKLTWELTPGGGEVGLIGFLLEKTASGTMLDMGCGQLIVDGKIKIKQGVDIEKLDADGIVFKDGSKIASDVIVLATGNEPIIANAVSILGEGIKEKVGSRIWGLDEEGELIRCYRPTGAPGLWFAPGAFQHPRFFSKHLALQILAEELGLKQL